MVSSCGQELITRLFPRLVYIVVTASILRSCSDYLQQHLGLGISTSVELRKLQFAQQRNESVHLKWLVLACRQRLRMYKYPRCLQGSQRVGRFSGCPAKHYLFWNLRPTLLFNFTAISHGHARTSAWPVLACSSNFIVDHMQDGSPLNAARCGI